VYVVGEGGIRKVVGGLWKIILLSFYPIIVSCILILTT